MTAALLGMAPLPTAVQRHVLRAGFFRQHSSRVAFSPSPREGSPPATEPVRRPAKVAQLLALAHHIQRAIDAGDVHDRATVARRLGFTRARVSQLLDLCLLAPDLQESVLELVAVDGAEPMSERALRAVVHAGSWKAQRGAWSRQR
jgi:hypothetical protein